MKRSAEVCLFFAMDFNAFQSGICLGKKDFIAFLEGLFG